jgi:hypothetical protein
MANSQFFIPDTVLFQELSGEAVLLNLDNEHYFGLNEVGTRFLALLKEHSNIKPVISQLLHEYDVDRQTLQNDLSHLLADLIDKGLVIENSQYT